MQIEKINNNKLKVILNLEDLKNNNIDFNSFMSNSLESQELFINILDLAEKDLQFYVDNSHLIIESISLSNSIFIFTITKQDKKRITNVSDYIYCFKSFDDICNIFKYININNLYLFNNEFFLIADSDRYINSIFEEFSYKKISSDYLKNILIEHSAKK